MTNLIETRRGSQLTWHPAALLASLTPGSIGTLWLIRPEMYPFGSGDRVTVSVTHRIEHGTAGTLLVTSAVLGALILAAAEEYRDRDHRSTGRQGTRHRPRPWRRWLAFPLAGHLGHSRSDGAALPMLEGLIVLSAAASGDSIARPRDYESPLPLILWSTSGDRGQPGDPSGRLLPL
jgi:hypothetical protein